MSEKRNRPADEQRKREQDVEDSLDAFLDASLPENDENSWVPPVLTPEDFEALVQTTPVLPKITDPPIQTMERSDSVVMGIHLNLNQSEGELLFKLRQLLSPHFQNSDFPTDQKIFLALLKSVEDSLENPDWLKHFQKILSQ